MKIDQIQDMSNDVILQEISSVEKELMNLRMGNTIGTIDNPLQIRQKRRDIARMKTVLRERELEIRKPK